MHSFGHVVSRWLVAGLILALATLVCSPVARAQQATDRSGELQQLVDALGEQIEMQRSFNRSKAEASQRQLQQAIKAWQQAARSDEDFHQMHDWLEQALQASLAGSRQRMPAVPTFSPPKVAAAPPEAATSPEPSPPTAGASPARGRVTEELPIATAEPPAEKPPVAAAQPRPATRREPAEVAKPASPWTRHPAATPIALGDPFVDDPLDTPAARQPDVAPAVATTPEPLAEGSRSTPPQSQPADPLQNARVVLRPLATETTRDDNAVAINLAALAARIRGHDRGLRGIEARLIANPDLAIEDLLLLAKELETLAEQRKLIDLYVEALNPAERSRVSPPQSAEDLKRLIGERAKRFRPTSQPDDLVDDVFSEQASPALEEIESVLKNI